MLVGELDQSSPVLLLSTDSGLKQKGREIAERSSLLIALMNEVLVGPIGDRDGDPHRRTECWTSVEIGFGVGGGFVVHDLITPLPQQSTLCRPHLHICFCFVVLLLHWQTTSLLTKSALTLLHILGFAPLPLRFPAI